MSLKLTTGTDASRSTHTSLRSLAGRACAKAIVGIFLPNCQPACVAHHRFSRQPAVSVSIWLRLKYWSIDCTRALSALATIWMPFAVLFVCVVVKGVCTDTAKYLLRRNRRLEADTGRRAVGGHQHMRVGRSRCVRSDELASVSALIGGGSAKDGHRSHSGACAICLEPKDGCLLRLLECSHSFHSGCVDTWLTRYCAMCPLCKAKIVLPK